MEGRVQDSHRLPRSPSRLRRADSLRPEGTVPRAKCCLGHPPSPSSCATSRPGTVARVWREVVQITPINYGATSCDEPAETPAAPACPNRTVCSELLTASSREPARGRVSRSSLAASLAGLQLRPVKSEGTERT